MPVEKNGSAAGKSSRDKKSTIELVNKEKRRLWLQNLILLEFPVRYFEEKYHSSFYDGMFDKPNKKGFEIIFHFLFCKLDKEKAAELFRHCYPVIDKKSCQKFRTVCMNWWKRISEEQPLFNFPKVSITLLMSPGGPEFYRIVFSFTTFMLYSEARKLDGEGEDNTLLPPVLSKNRSISTSQIVALKSACHHESLETLHAMQLSEHIDQKALKLAESMLQQYREKMKRKEQLEKQKKDMMEKLKIPLPRMPGTPSRSTIPQTPDKVLNLKINKSLTIVREQWKKLLSAVDDTAGQREIIDSVVSVNEAGSGLDAAKLAPKVPAALLQQRTQEVYNNVGTSLYRAGQLDLISIIKLFNLALHLFIEKLHEVGVPNFEGQIPYINAQSHIHKKNIAILKDIGLRLDQTIPQTVKINDMLEKKVDQEGDSRSAECGKELIPGLPKPQFQSTELPGSGEDALGLLPLSPPFQFSDNMVNATPSMLPDQFTGFERQLKEMTLLRDVPSFPVSPATRNLPHGPQEGSTILSCSPALMQGTLKFGPGTSPKTSREVERMKKTLLQRRAMQRKFATKREDLPKSVPEHIDRNLKASSLPSTPIAKPVDTTIEKVTSRTPEAVRNLINQVVDYTMTEMSVKPGYIPSETSPPDVARPAFFDISSQLDMSVFMSKNKVERTPPVSFVHDASSPLIPESSMKEIGEPLSSVVPDSLDDSSSQSSTSKDSSLTDSRIADQILKHGTTTLDDIDFSNYPSIMDAAPPDILTPSFFLDSPGVPDLESPDVPVGNLIDL